MRVRVEATGAQTRMGRLMAMVEACTRAKAPVVELADRVSVWFVFTVLALALLTAALWWRRGETAAIEHAIALLIVSCPCALGLATPLALVVAIGRAAARGLLIKGGAALQALAASRATLLFDKTGTLTEGRMAVTHVWGDASVRPLVAALERDSTHPVGRALAAWGEAEPAGACAAPPPERCEALAGGGVRGVVAGTNLLVGAPAAIERVLGPLPEAVRNEVEACAQRAWTPVVIARDGAIAAVLGVGDRPRPEAQQTLRALERLGYTIGLVSGDHPEVVRALARQLGIAAERVWGGQRPEDKLAHVEAARRRGEVVIMVGDGVNDAAALAAASVGVAVHGGAEASLEAADVYIGGAGVAPLLALVRGARTTMRVIQAALAVSLGYNALAVGLAMAGAIHPLLAAVLMPASSLSVVSIVLASRAFGEPKR